MGTPFASSPSQKVYRNSSLVGMKRVLRSAYVIAVYGAFFLYTWFYAHWDPGLKISATVLTALLGGFGLFMYIQTIRMHLVTSPEGMTFFGMGYRLFTPWENVAGKGNRDKRTGLELQQPAPLFEVKTIFRFLVPAHAPTFIPISSVITDWQDSTLAEDMRHYAPHIFSRGQGSIWTNDT